MKLFKELFAPTVVMFLILSCGILLIYTSKNVATYSDCCEVYLGTPEIKNLNTDSISPQSKLQSEPTPNPNPDRIEWRQERNLQAQVEMANRATWMIFVSILTAFISVIGFYLVWSTLKESITSNKLLSDQNKISLLASELEYQPYISVSDIKPLFDVRRIFIGNGRTAGLCGVILITNLGKTAMFVSKISTVQKVTIFNNEDMLRVTSEQLPDVVEHEIIPNGKHEITVFLDFEIPEEFDADNLLIHNLYFEVATKIEFDDMFSISNRSYKEIWIYHSGFFEPERDSWGNIIEDENDQSSFKLRFQQINNAIRSEMIHKTKRIKTNSQKSISPYF